MKRVVLLILLVLVAPAAAGEDQVPLKAAQAADKVLEVVEAGDQAALEALAARDDPDPWRVAAELCDREAHGAADAFARAAPRIAVEKLPAYVASRREAKPDPAGRKRLAAANEALRADAWQRALTALGPFETPLPASVGAVREASARATALTGLQRWGEAASTLTAAGTTAQRMGWLVAAASFHARAAYMAWRNASYGDAVASLERARAVQERLGDKAAVATSTSRMGLVYLERGDHKQALPLLKGALALQEELGDRGGASRTLVRIGNVHLGLGDYDAALEFQARALAIKEALGDRKGVATARNNMGNVHLARGDFKRALATFQQVLAMQTEGKHDRDAALTLNNLGIAYAGLGDYKSALAAYQRALALNESLADRAGVARTLGNIGSLHSAVGDYPAALAALERALDLKRALGDGRGAAATLSNIGNVQFRLGDYTRALATYERAQEAQIALGDKAVAALTLGNIGAVHESLGNHAKALAAYEQALAAKRALGDKSGAASTLGNLGVAYDNLGDHGQALSILERALAAHEAVGDKAGVAMTLGNIGNVYKALGDTAKALAIQERAWALKEAVRDKAGAAMTLANIGALHADGGDHAKAFAAYERALELQEALGNKAGVAHTLVNLGQARHALGQHDAARATLEKAVRLARRLRATPVLVRALTRLADVHLEAGEPGLALGRAREALREVEGMLGALGEEEGATARERHTDLFGIGTLAAAAEGDLAEVLTFLESGRAGALLDALGERELLRWKAERLPAALRQADLEARTARRLARRAYDRAREGGVRSETRRTAKAFQEATEAVRAVTARIQREVKQQAGLFYPRAETIEAVRASLEPDQALVLYGLCLDQALALVLRGDSERLVSLGSAAEVREACEALHLSDATSDPRAPLEDLKRLLVGPLKLAGDVKEVLVSPEGPLCYLPLAALFEQAVATTPSGTTHVLLKSGQRAWGTKVLALGDPDYGLSPDVAALSVYRGSGTLVPLPGTREEAETVGDVVLLGAEASEPEFRRTVATETQWRAVHLACHGLVRPAQPMLSSLALTRAGDDDGFLTCGEILRMEVPADLAVLSACETATGRIVQGEGIVGLTRAFMYAGSPRVLCSLWRVDDAATKALMIKFYELWHPRSKPGDPEPAARKAMSAAEALQQAQAFVRGHEKWKHPYYWAAWVLWGLPR